MAFGEKESGTRETIIHGRDSHTKRSTRYEETNNDEETADNQDIELEMNDTSTKEVGQEPEESKVEDELKESEELKVEEPKAEET
jgi:hypothetical protein